MTLSLENHVVALWDYYTNVVGTSKPEAKLSLEQYLETCEVGPCRCGQPWGNGFGDHCLSHCLRAKGLDNALGAVRDGTMFRISAGKKKSSVYRAYKEIHDLILANQALALTSNVYWMTVWHKHDHSNPLKCHLDYSQS